VYESAELLDRAFRDPRDPHNPFGFQACVTRDEHGVFPAVLCSAAREAGLHTCYLPTHPFDEALMRVRTAARRDVALMPGVMISITALYTVLIGGSAEQRRRVTELVGRGGTISFGLSEEDSGSDVLAGTCRLAPDDGGYRLTGEKWLVALGGRCDALLVVARTGERGPGAFTAVLLDRDALPADTVDVS
jgi:alkylation response protein AidB-like acyl-CoA dehydrogenase